MTSEPFFLVGLTRTSSVKGGRRNGSYVPLFLVTHNSSFGRIPLSSVEQGVGIAHDILILK